MLYPLSAIAIIEGKKAVTCADPHLDPVTAWWGRTRALDGKPEITFSSSAGMVSDGNAFVTTVVTVTVTGADGVAAGQQSRTFLFDVADEQGWKVCAATT